MGHEVGVRAVRGLFHQVRDMRGELDQEFARHADLLGVERLPDFSAQESRIVHAQGGGEVFDLAVGDGRLSGRR
jgi:hypothetical protein